MRLPPKAAAGIVGFIAGGSCSIAVNAAQPGSVETDMNLADGPFAETLKGFMAITRYALGGEIAAMVSCPADPEAGSITGACLAIDGGFTA